MTESDDRQDAAQELRQWTTVAARVLEDDQLPWSLSQVREQVPDGTHTDSVYADQQNTSSR